MEDCNVCIDLNSERDPLYYVSLSTVDGFKDLYTFSSREKLVDFLLSVHYRQFLIEDIGLVSGHDFIYAWDV